MPRPHPYSMAASYTTWRGLTDRRYTGRHLPEHEPVGGALPPREELINLFVRQNKQTLSHRSSMLFAAFAQWFTDSFLRTEHGFIYDENGNPEFESSFKLKRSPDRHRFNTSNHEIDLCQIYGLTEVQTRILRTLSEKEGEKGCLKYQLVNGAEYPPYILEGPTDWGKPLKLKQEFAGLHDEKVLRVIFGQVAHSPNAHARMFAVGLEHGNSTIANSLMNTIFLREHNRIARQIAHDFPGWDDERVFQTTRNTMIVLLLKIVISDYIRHITPFDLPLEFIPGLADGQEWYRTNRMTIEFNLLYRWHQLIPDKLLFLQELGEYRNNNQLIMERGVRRLVRELSLEPAGRIGLFNTAEALRSVEEDTLDLMRAARLAPYNEYRKRFGQPPVKSFEALTGDTALAAVLRTKYGDIDRLEWYVGIFAERHAPNAIMGGLLTTMVAWDAFTQALTNPLLAKGVFNEATFSKTGWRIIQETLTLEDMLSRHPETKGPITCAFDVSRAKEQFAAEPREERHAAVQPPLAA